MQFIMVENYDDGSQNMVVGGGKIEINTLAERVADKLIEMKFEGLIINLA